MIDLDNDKDFDLVVGTKQGNLRYFENTGTAAAPDFSEQSGADNPFDHSITSIRLMTLTTTMMSPNLTPILI